MFVCVIFFGKDKKKMEDEALKMKNKVCCFSVFGLRGNFSLHEAQ